MRMRVAGANGAQAPAQGCCRWAGNPSMQGPWRRAHALRAEQLDEERSRRHLGGHPPVTRGCVLAGSGSVRQRISAV